ncbi:MAG: penicillin-binding protein [Chlorobiaceae bacterium]|nr:penicillin-binding protein [Chlorobiaceae bacterium]
MAISKEKFNKKLNTSKSFFRKYLKIFILFTVLFVGGFTYYVFSGLPSLEQLENPTPQLASKVYTVDGELLGQFFIENRIEANIDSVPKFLIDALIATEDRKFFNHWGVDLDRLMKAIVKNIFTFSREGASTITQQLAKNLYGLKSSDENIFETGIRKIREWITAVQIERNFTKKEILELYFNVSFFGKSAYGIETASNIYFDKRVTEINLNEAAVLVALLKSHVIYDPERRPENALRRRNLVLYTMVDAGYLDQATYEKLITQPIVLARGKRVKLRGESPHFLEFIRQQMSAMADEYGYDLYRDGLSIYTTIDMRMQKIANRVTAEHIREYQELFNKSWSWERNKTTLNQFIDQAIKNDQRYKNATTPSDKLFVSNELKNNVAFVDSVKKDATTVEVGFVVIDPKTGEIRAMVGGSNPNILHGLNHVSQIRRQPGSSFKPIIYTVAIDNGYFPKFSLLNEKFDYNGWSPGNSDDAYGGYMSFREALAKSVNVIAGRLTISNIAPPEQVIKYAKMMGINTKLTPYPAIALGTSEVSPLELTSAFATLANAGVYISPISILRIEDRNGVIIDEFRPEIREAISPETAAIVTNMMEDVLSYGTGAGVRKWFHRPAAGKTGTTQDFADAWFAGFTPQLAGGVWVGFDDRRVRFTNWYGQGGRAAMPIWAKFMAETYKELNLPLEYFTLPENVISVEFCRESIIKGDSKLANGNCPSKVSDIVNKNRLPLPCDIHSNGRATRGGSGW